jgi:GTP pyrophosphokinase
MVPLNTPLKKADRGDRGGQAGRLRATGSTPSGYLVAAPGQGARLVQRHRFAGKTRGQGRALIEKTLQREGKTAVLETQPRGSTKSTDDLTRPRQGRVQPAACTCATHPEGEAQPEFSEEEAVTKKSRATSVARAPRRAGGGRGFADDADVALLQAGAARMISSASSRGAGVSIHRRNCNTFMQMSRARPSA